MSASLERDDTLRPHKRLHRLAPHQSLQQLMYPNLHGSIEYNNLNSPPSSAPVTSSSSSLSPSSSFSASLGVSTLEKYSSVLIGELKRKPLKEKLLKDALEVQEKIHQLEGQLQAAESEAIQKRSSLEEQLEELERKKEETRKNIDLVGVDLENCREEIRSSIKSLQNNPDFRDRNAIERLSKEIEQLNHHTTRVKTLIKISDDSTNLEDNSMLCPVCLSVPEDQIFTCCTCDNMVCGACRGQLHSCPTCRKNFKSNPPKRNRLAERLIACRRQ